MARRFEASEKTIYKDLTATMRKLGATSLRVPQRAAYEAAIAELERRPASSRV